jgi:hypothetical protein
MAEDLVDETGEPVTDDIGILKIRLDRIVKYGNDLMFLVNKKAEAPLMFKFADGKTESLSKTVEEKDGQFDKAIAETKQKIQEEAGKL